MKHLGIILLFFLCTLSATAQLPYIIFQKQPSSGIHSPSCDASGNIYLGGTSPKISDDPAWNWDEKYVIIALENGCTPDSISCSIHNTSGDPTYERSLFAPGPIYTIYESADKGFIEGRSIWTKQTKDYNPNNPYDLKKKLSPTTRYIKLSYKGNFAAIFSDLTVISTKTLVSIKAECDGESIADPKENSYPCGNTVQIEAMEIDGYCFSEWDDHVTTPSRTITVPTTTTSYTAHYVKQVDVIIQSNNSELGLVYFQDDGSSTKAAEKSKKICPKAPITVVAEPSSCYTFSHWESDGKEISKVSHYTFNPGNDTTITAVFKQVKVTIKSNNPELGLVYFEDDGSSTKAEEKSKTICPGTSITVVAVPEEGKSFSHWESSNWEQKPTDQYYNFDPDNDVTITAVFNDIVAHSKQIAIDDNIVNGTQESIEYEGDCYIEYGSDVDRDFPCHRISKLLRRNTSTNEEEEIEPTVYRSPDYSYVEFEMPKGNISYIFTLVLTPIQYHIKVYNQEEEIKELSVSEKYDCDKGNTYTFNKQCYEFKEWDANYTIHKYDENSDSGVTSENKELSETEQNNPTLTIPSESVEDITFTAYVTPKQYTISVTIEPDEEGDPHGSVNIKQGDEILTNPATIPCGAKVTLTAIPETCYEFVEWTKENDPDFKDSDNPLEIYPGDIDDAENATYIAHFRPIGVQLYLITLDENKKEIPEEVPKELTFDYTCGQKYILNPTDYINDPCLTFYRWRIEPEDIFAGADGDKITIPSELEHSITIYLDAIPKTFTASVSVQPELDSEGNPKKDSSGKTIYHGKANINKVPPNTGDNTEP